VHLFYVEVGTKLTIPESGHRKIRFSMEKRLKGRESSKI